MENINKIDTNELTTLINKCNYGLNMLETQLNILIKDYEYKNNLNAVEHVKTRIKSEESILKKLERRGYELTIDNVKSHIHDIVGVRIVCSFLKDVYQIAELIENSNQIKVIKKEDYIKKPKDTGYTSYHLNVLVPIYLDTGTEYIEAEIQIRTMAMDFWASLDHKIQYKFPTEIPEEVKKEMFNCSLDIISLDHKMLELNKIVNKYMQNK